MNVVLKGYMQEQMPRGSFPLSRLPTGLAKRAKHSPSPADSPAATSPQQNVEFLASLKHVSNQSLTYYLQGTSTFVSHGVVKQTKASRDFISFWHLASTVKERHASEAPNSTSKIQPHS